VSCNGSDAAGQLGDGAGDDESTIADEAAVVGLTDAIQLTSSVAHSCALTSTGEVRCWGGNNGNLGDGTVDTRFAPVAAIGVTGAVRIDTFWGTTCALGPLGAMQCWGANEAGQIDASNGAAAVLRPEPVDRVDTVREVAVGQHHICAVRAYGEVHCWGRNTSGQLGDGTTEDRAEPVAGASVFGAVLAVDAGPDHTCVISNDAGQLNLACWGGNAHGQLGRPPSDGPSASPLPVDLPNLRYSQ
jgi:alpha-tubulin suppressor-like RCC1 family protein